MKNFLFLILLLVPVAIFSQNKKNQAPPPPPPKQAVSQQNAKEIFTVVEQMPSFPGGEKALDQFIREHMIYPTEAAQHGTQGKVYVTFVVEADGTLSEIALLRGIGSGCDEEAVRIVKAMPKWNPGMQRGVAVRVQFNQLIKFEINKENQFNEK
jgi:protein TonB